MEAKSLQEESSISNSHINGKPVLLSLQSICLLEVIKNPNNIRHLSKLYRDFYNRINHHFITIYSYRTELFKQKCLVGSVKWLENLYKHLLNRTVDILDNDILVWTVELILAKSSPDRYKKEYCSICNEKYRFNSCYPSLVKSLSNGPRKHWLTTSDRSFCACYINYMSDNSDDDDDSGDGYYDDEPYIKLY